MNRLIKTLSFIVLLVCTAHSQAELKVIVTKTASNAQPIAIVPFGWGEATPPPQAIAQVISSDLARSGQFKPLPAEDMLAKPTSGQAVNYANWRALGINHLVVGKLESLADGRYAVNFQLLDVIRGRQVLGQRLTVSQKRLRRTAHHIADLVYEKLTGIRGAFDTRIAYISVNRNAANKPIYRLQIADADGYNPRTLVQSSQPLLSPTWSPDGVHLAYVSFRNRQAEVFAINLRTGKEQKLPGYEGISGAPAFSPDGKKLAMALSRKGNADIYVLDMQSRELKRITRGFSIETEPTWSADGERILFTSGRTGNPQIYEVDSDGGPAKRVSFDGKYNASATISFDDRYIAMVHRQGKGYRIGVQDRKNGLFRVLTEGGQDESPSFAPNGTMILYAAKENGRGVLAAVSTDGRTRQRLQATGGGDIREPAWSPYPAR